MTAKTPAISSIKRISKTSTSSTPKVAKVPVEKPSKESLVKKVTPLNKANLIENVTSHREVKYIYPEDVVDTLSRKSWRQKVRDELNKHKLALVDFKDQSSKEYKAAYSKYEAYMATVMK